MPELSTAGRITVDSLTKRFGGVTAVDDVSFTLEAGSATAIIGPNGAGKSTVLKMISAVYRPTAGSIQVSGHLTHRIQAHQVARAGIGFAHQVPRPFRGLTIAQNIEVAIAGAGRGADIDEILELSGLARISARTPASLGVLDLKRLEVARALASRPEVLLLDEIAAGLVGRELDQAIELVRSIHRTGVTILLVEHVEAVVRSIVDRVIVLDWGKMIADGTPAEVAADERVREVYLGSGEHDVGEHAHYVEAPADLLLDASGISAGYGGSTVVRDVSVSIGRGEVVALLGANGAGKSTICGALSGLIARSAGTITLAGRDISTSPPHERNRSGISHCPEGRQLFTELSVRENLELGAPMRLEKSELRDRIETVCQVFPALRDKIGAVAGSLSGGQQQMVAVARALMSRPQLLICDEVSLGLSPVAIDDLYEGLERVRQEGTAILLVEQNVGRCLAFANRAYVLNRGRLSFSGDPAVLADLTALDHAYFGSPDAA